MPAAARARYAGQVRSRLRGQLLASPLHAGVAADLSEALRSAESEPPGARTILSLSAPFAAGKSSLIKAWAYGRHREWLGRAASDDLPERPLPGGGTADWVPVIYVTLMARTNARDLYGTILAFLGYPTRGPHRDLALNATTALGVHGVRLIVVDDAHMLTTASVTGRAALDALKQINTELGELGGTLVLVGAHLTGGGALTDPQIRGRLLEHQLRPYRLSDTDDIPVWQHFLLGIEEGYRTYLPDMPVRDLAQRFGGKIYGRTQGFLGDVATLLAGATEAALLDRRTALDPGDLSGIRLSQRATDAEPELALEGPATRTGQPTPNRSRAAS